MKITSELNLTNFDFWSGAKEQDFTYSELKMKAYSIVKNNRVGIGKNEYLIYNHAKQTYSKRILEPYEAFDLSNEFDMEQISILEAKRRGYFDFTEENIK